MKLEDFINHKSFKSIQEFEDCWEITFEPMRDFTHHGRQVNLHGTVQEGDYIIRFKKQVPGITYYETEIVDPAGFKEALHESIV